VSDLLFHAAAGVPNLSSRMLMWNPASPLARRLIGKTLDVGRR
jgi:hypothetical protein